MKLEKILVLASLVMAFAPCVYAGEIEQTDIKFKVQGTGAAEEQFRMSIFNTDGTMVWIDTQKADADGKYYFEFSFDKSPDGAEYDLYINGAAERIKTVSDAEAKEELQSAADESELEKKISDYGDRFEYDVQLWASTELEQHTVRNSIFRDLLKTMDVKSSFMSAVGVAKFNEASQNKNRGMAKEALDKYGEYMGLMPDSQPGSGLSSSRYDNLIVKLMSDTYNSLDSFKAAYSKARSSVLNSGGSSGGAGGGLSGGTTGRPSPKPSGSLSGGVSGQGMIGQPAAAPEPFNDLGSVPWAKENIINLYNKGIVSGKEYGVFAPNDDVAREEFVAMVVRLLKLEAKQAKEFEDIAEGSWYKSAVDAAYENGIISGISDTEFGTGLPVTRQDCAVICANVLKLYGKEYAGDNSTLFEDSDSIADYAVDAVYQMKKAGVISGMGDNIFAPRAVCSRAMAARIIDIVGGIIKWEEL